MTTIKHDPRVLFVCACCDEFRKDESPARPIEDIAVMPDGTWLCNECYSECEKMEYGFPDPQNRDESYEHPEFEDLPKPTMYGSEREILEAAIDRMGWPEIRAFNEERKKGQDIYEDAGGFWMRAIRRLFGLPSPYSEIETYQQAARRMVAEAEAGR